MKNLRSLIFEFMILNSLSYNKYVNFKRSDKELVLLFYFKLINVIKVYKLGEVWFIIKYIKCKKKIKKFVLLGLDN